VGILAMAAHTVAKLWQSKRSWPSRSSPRHDNSFLATSAGLGCARWCRLRERRGVRLPASAGPARTTWRMVGPLLASGHMRWGWGTLGCDACGRGAKGHLGIRGRKGDWKFAGLYGGHRFNLIFVH
jgi:hypothetical protein